MKKRIVAIPVKIECIMLEEQAYYKDWASEEKGDKDPVRIKKLKEKIMFLAGEIERLKILFRVGIEELTVEV